MTPTISIAGTALLAANLPDIKIEMRKGTTTYRVVVTQDAAFVAAIITACVIGATIAVAVDGMTFTGTVTGFGVRTGHSILQVTEATCAH